MYHATKIESAESILKEGQFRYKLKRVCIKTAIDNIIWLSRPSGKTSNMLGAGVYASHTYQKAVNHGRAHIDYKGRFVVFKLLVYVGKVFS